MKLGHYVLHISLVYRHKENPFKNRACIAQLETIENESKIICYLLYVLNVSWMQLKAVDTIGKLLKIIISIKPYLVTSNGGLLEYKTL